jgi:hypothetical protein
MITGMPDVTAIKPCDLLTKVKVQIDERVQRSALRPYAGP